MTPARPQTPYPPGGGGGGAGQTQKKIVHLTQIFGPFDKIHLFPKENFSAGGWVNLNPPPPACERPIGAATG